MLTIHRAFRAFKKTRFDSKLLTQRWWSYGPRSVQLLADSAARILTLREFKCWAPTLLVRWRSCLRASLNVQANNSDGCTRISSKKAL
jgi:hypothetical protein